MSTKKNWTDFEAFLNAADNGLKEHEKRVMRLRLGLEDGRPRTVNEVAEALGMSHERVRAIQAKFIRRFYGLGCVFSRKKPKDFLD